MTKKEADEYNKIVNWLNKRSMKELKMLAFSGVKFGLQEGKTLKDIEDFLKKHKEDYKNRKKH